MSIDATRRDGIDALCMNSMERGETERFGWLRAAQQPVRDSGHPLRVTESSIWNEVNINSSKCILSA